MERSTVITLLVVLGLGGLVLWWYMSNDATPAAQPTAGTCGNGVMGSIGQFINGHVDRKNAIAPLVASAYVKVPPSQLAGVTNLAGKLSPSGYLEAKIGGAVGNFFCHASLPSLSMLKNAVANNPITKTSTSFGTSQLAAGTVGPVKSLGSAANNFVHGNFGDAGKDVAKSVYEGPKSAATATYNAVKSLNPF